MPIPQEKITLVGWASCPSYLFLQEVYSSNMGDFCRLHRTFAEQKRTHAGIIVVPRQSYSVGAQWRGILNLMASKSAEEMINQLEYLGAYIRAE